MSVNKTDRIFELHKATDCVTKISIFFSNKLKYMINRLLSSDLLIINYISLSKAIYFIQHCLQFFNDTVLTKICCGSARYTFISFIPCVYYDYL